jgi:hypothetical protein
MLPCHLCGKETITALDRAHYVPAEQIRAGAKKAVVADGKVKVYYCPSCQKEWEKSQGDNSRAVLTVLGSVLGGVGVGFISGVWWIGLTAVFVLGFVLSAALDAVVGRHEKKP